MITKSGSFILDISASKCKGAHAMDSITEQFWGNHVRQDSGGAKNGNPKGDERIAIKTK